MKFVLDMNVIQNHLAQADDSQLYEIMVAIIRQRKSLHPDWDLLFLSLPTDPDLREKELQNILPLLRATANENEPR